MHLLHLNRVGCRCLIGLLKALLLLRQIRFFLQELARVALIACQKGFLRVLLHLLHFCAALVQFSLGLGLSRHHSRCLSLHFSQITFNLTQILIDHFLRILCLVQQRIDVR